MDRPKGLTGQVRHGGQFLGPEASDVCRWCLRNEADSVIDDSMALTDVPPQLALADGDDPTVGNDDVVAKKRGFRIEYQDTFNFGRFWYSFICLLMRKFLEFHSF